MSHGFRLISKLAAQPHPLLNAQDVKSWDSLFLRSCERLGVQALDSFLLHSPADLLKPGGKYLEEWLQRLREQCLVKRIGLSIYTKEDLEGLNLDLFDMVQLPLSLYDQRLLMDGTIHKLRSHGIAIHARSLYLQGLILTPSSQWPSWVSTDVRNHHEALESHAERRGCRLIDLAIGFAQGLSDVEAVVIGVCSLEELVFLTDTWKSISPWKEAEWARWGLQDAAILDPRRWPL